MADLDALTLAVAGGLATISVALASATWANPAALIPTAIYAVWVLGIVNDQYRKTDHGAVQDRLDELEDRLPTADGGDA